MHWLVTVFRKEFRAMLCSSQLHKCNYRKVSTDCCSDMAVSCGKVLYGDLLFFLMIFTLFEATIQCNGLILKLT